MKNKVIHIGATYNTRSNKRRIIKTESGKLIARKIKKRGKIHRCCKCERKMTSIAAMRPAKFGRQKISKKRVNRPFGSSLCCSCLEERIISSFMEQESKVIGKQ